MDTEYEKSRIERMKRGLYKPGDDEVSGEITPLTPVDAHVQTDWESTPSVHVVESVTPRQSTRIEKLLKVFVILAILASVLSGGYLAYQYFDPLRQLSDKNIFITFETPVGVTPGVPADIVVHVTNQNHAALENVTIALEYPSGTRSADDPTREEREQKKDIGAIAAGGTALYSGRAILLGEENEEKEVRAVLTYRFAGVNSSLTKEVSRTSRILSSPVNLVITTLHEVNSGQSLDVAIKAESNTVIPLNDVLIKVDYPQGFTYTDAEPKPAFGNNIWRAPRLDPTEKFPIAIHGFLEGSDTEERVFRTAIGVSGDRTGRDIVTTYGKILSTVTVKRPFIGVALSINGKPAGDAVASYGQSISGVVHWQNNLPVKISNAEIEVRLHGAVLDRTSIKAENGGFYRSIDNTILWDERGDSDLAFVESGQSGIVSFAFSPLPRASGNQLVTDPNITAEVTVRGKRLSDDPSKVPEEINSVTTQTVRIASESQFVARSAYFVGPFVNSGPIPPQVEKETTFTVVWNIVNTTSNITDARVVGVLPSYVKWYGTIMPSTEKITYDPATNSVVWLPGDIPSGTGIAKPPREVAFQVVLLPSLSQVGATPLLVTGIKFDARDTYTNTMMTKTVRDVTTDLTTDPKAPEKAGVVVE